MAREEIDPQLPYIQVARSVSSIATQLQPTVKVDLSDPQVVSGLIHRAIRGGLDQFWEGLNDREILFKALMLQRPRVLLEPKDLEVRLILAFGGMKVDPAMLVPLRVIEPDQEEGFENPSRVRGMSRYLKGEWVRYWKKGCRKCIAGETGQLNIGVAEPCKRCCSAHLDVLHKPIEGDDVSSDSPPNPPRWHPGGTGEAPRSHHEKQSKSTVPPRSHAGGTPVAPRSHRGDERLETRDERLLLPPPPNPLPRLSVVPPPTANGEEELENQKRLEELDAMRAGAQALVQLAEGGDPPTALEGDDPDVEPPEKPFTDAEFLALWSHLREKFGHPPEKTVPKSFSLDFAAMQMDFGATQIVVGARRYLDPKDSAGKGLAAAEQGYPLRIFLKPSVYAPRMGQPYQRRRLCCACLPAARVTAETSSPTGRGLCLAHYGEWSREFEEQEPADASVPWDERNERQKEHFSVWRRANQPASKAG